MKLTAKNRKLVNERLFDISRVRHVSIPMKDIGDVLRMVGLKIEEAILCGRDSRATFNLYQEEEEVSNSMLVLSWYKDYSQTTYEINCYLS